MIQPPETCPNEGVCVDMELERRHNDMKSDWTKTLISTAIAVSLAIGSGALGWLLNHENRVTSVERNQENGSSAADKQLKADIEKLDARWDARLMRIEDKIDSLRRK